MIIAYIIIVVIAVVLFLAIASLGMVSTKQKKSEETIAKLVDVLEQQTKTTKIIADVVNKHGEVLRATKVVMDKMIEYITTKSHSTDNTEQMKPIIQQIQDMNNGLS